MITVEQLARATGSTLTRASCRLMDYNKILPLFEINTAPRVAMFLANVGHETGGFRFISEIWGPTPAQRRYTRDFASPWPANDEEAKDPKFETNRLAYTLGNVAHDDGFDYRGRGDLETTGRRNYHALTFRLQRRFVKLHVPDFVVNPEKLAETHWACFSACDYADMKGLNAVADSGNFDHYCDLVNKGHITPQVGDTNGWANRAMLFTFAKAIIGPHLS